MSVLVYGSMFWHFNAVSTCITTMPYDRSYGGGAFTLAL